MGFLYFLFWIKPSNTFSFVFRNNSWKVAGESNMMPRSIMVGSVQGQYPNCDTITPVTRISIVYSN